MPAGRRIGVDIWLDPERTEPGQIYEVLDGIVLEPLAVRPVPTRANPRRPTAELLKPFSEDVDEALQLTLTPRAA